ncbi:RHS repeat domain-containing protein [Leptospira sp. mild_001]|uniref:RHS repeat domain-containing protein n=1 Tax=Leptospira sp. mild_001 TaxID=2838238 RepID=UPI0031FEFB22
MHLPTLFNYNITFAAAKIRTVTKLSSIAYNYFDWFVFWWIISVQVNTNGILPGYCNKDIVENITYNEFGQTSSLTLGNGITTSYGYDVKGRMVF